MEGELDEDLDPQRFAFIPYSEPRNTESPNSRSTNLHTTTARRIVTQSTPEPATYGLSLIYLYEIDKMQIILKGPLAQTGAGAMCEFRRRVEEMFYDRFIRGAQSILEYRN